MKKHAKEVRSLKLKAKKTNSLIWLTEPLEDFPTYLRKKMFGCEAIYLEGRLVLVLADGEKPWDGILVPMNRENHASLRDDLPALKPHPVLGKWLYIPQSDDSFEKVAHSIIRRIRRGDVRIGVEPKPRKGRKDLLT